jgi:hypothetical protein
MGVRPPAGGDGEAELIEFGIAALDAELSDRDVSFPATQEELLSEIGDIDIEYDASGSSVRFSRALERTDQSTFDSERELLNALHPVFEDLRQRGSPGLIGWLRSVFS